MANLNFIEKSKFESLFEMQSGYVIDFTDRTFQEFILDSIGMDIYDKKYNFKSGSKANRLRQFWTIESNYIVGKLLDSFLQYWLLKVQSGKIKLDEANEIIYKDCKIVVDKLKREALVDNIDALKPNNDDKDFALLTKSIKKSIEENEPELALDRLHTFVMKYVRELCNKYSIPSKKEDPLHSLFGAYVKFLLQQKRIDSKMTEIILKSSISALDAFNDIRNNKSLAHDNPVLNFHESTLIFNNIANVINFIENLERPLPIKEENSIDDLFSSF